MSNLNPYFSLDMDSTLTRHAALEDARVAADGELDRARDESADGGWPEETTRICYGVVIGEVVETSHKSIEELEAEGDESAAESMRANGFDYMATHALVENGALRDVLAERQKQRVKWGDAHDDEHDNPRALPLAAATIAIGTFPGVPWHMFADAPDWVRSLVERHGDRDRLVIAAALLLAEIERLDRANPSPEPKP